jgi:hypothetical protein
MNGKAILLIGVYYLCKWCCFYYNVSRYLRRYPNGKINIDLYGLYIWSQTKIWTKFFLLNKWDCLYNVANITWSIFCYTFTVICSSWLEAAFVFFTLMILQDESMKMKSANSHSTKVIQNERWKIMAATNFVSNYIIRLK